MQQIGNLFSRITLILFLLFTGLNFAQAQHLSVYNKNGKAIKKFREGQSLDFRLAYRNEFPGTSLLDSVAEVRITATIYRIDNQYIHLKDAYIIGYYGLESYTFNVQNYVGKTLKIKPEEIYALSFTGPMEKVGDAIFKLSAALTLSSPLFGITGKGEPYSVNDVKFVAKVGAVGMGIGGAIFLIFRTRAIYFKDFEGVTYFKKYRKGRLDIEY